MNFFEYQDKARRNTLWLVFLFIAGVAGTVAALYVALVLILVFTGAWEPAEGASLWSPELLLGITLFVGGVLAFGSGSRYLTLRKGGSAVARSLGGRPLSHDTADPAERRLLNVVEEMAIASGTPVPPVYVLEEEGINAFAAGHSMNDAVVGITRGALDTLERDELQGVIAHEFSHIVNQDVRLNLRLMVIIAGLIALSVLGRHVLYSFGRAGMMRSRRRMGGRNGGGQGQIVILLAGLAFLVIGAIGVWSSRLIKAAISRQREYLADASAVQFTRNPQGLAGALKKIRGHGARVRHPNAEEASHLFFGDALSRSRLASLLSTHPPLNKRIARLDASYEGAAPDLSTAAPTGAGPVSMLAAEPSSGPRLELDAGMIRNQVGTLSNDQLAYGHDMLERLPSELRRSAHESLGAIALAFALVLDEESAHRKRQMEILRSRAEAATLEEIERLEDAVRDLDPWLRLPLAELLMPALRTLTREQYAAFASTLSALMLHDEELTIFQFALMKMILHQLEQAYREGGRRTRSRPSSAVGDDIHVVLSALANAGSDEPEERLDAFHRGLARLDKPAHNETLVEDSFERLSQALDRLAGTSPHVKEQVIDAAGHVVLADRLVNLQEAELLRTVAVTLDCPLPPFIPRARVA